MSEIILDVRDLQVQFKTDTRTVKAVDGISFQVKRGQTLGIVGESGSGKSVTSLAVMGLVPNPPGRVTGGEIWFSDAETIGEPIDLLRVPVKELQNYRGDRLSMIFQEPMSSLNPVYTCGFQLTEAIRLHEKISESQAQRRAVSLLQEVKLLPPDEELKRRFLEEFYPDGTQPSQVEIDRQINRQKLAMLDRYPHELSGGQIQRVMIAMAISCNPTLLIADEPTTALDVTVQATILDLLRDLRNRRGMGMMFITHDLSLIAEIADQVAVMYEGKIVEYGSVLDIFSNPQHPYTKGLLTCRPQPDRRLRYLPTVSDFMEVSRLRNGETLIEAKQQDVNAALRSAEEISDTEFNSRLQELQKKPPLVSVQNLQVAFPVRGIFGQTKRYVMAVNDVSFDVYPGETLGLVGESGCGKTTLARTLLRLIEAKTGKVLFEGKDILSLPPKQVRQLRREAQIIFQNPYSSLDPRLNIGEAVMEPLQIYSRGKGKQHQERAAYLLQRVGLDPDLMKRYPHEFSGGQRQRVCIARSLALNPKFIICDESVSALDVSVQAQVLNLLKELQSEFGLTYIFISHDLSVVKFMSDRIVVMNRGKIEEVGTADTIYRHPQQPYTRQLIAAIPVGTLDRIRERQEQRGLSAS
ncbi:ABC transporter ATP-binding protein [Phormidesmis priestleyi ULC007]|uniref:ABC transporter ATP-binding protein n=1 Tax=Phormidesmis priestleyi ULC007 TaxID=1920490 RepID=A0A2T1DLV1_9CYAN|nr:ABC transporter ATP-binding protein [Phormidesmis priestleyi]PSB21463.1 ABC transporter ATP-binding protein [Phormidesmis priestleyi ULC007]PZO46703.1 MAG: ABC transporter ATP-binding protein [Phormidesmis priestleyi]